MALSSARVLCVALSIFAVYVLSACGVQPAALPAGLRDGILQELMSSGYVYHSYEVDWTITTIGDLQAAVPAAGDDIVSGTSYVKLVYVAELHGSFHNSLCTPGHGATCRGTHLLVALPITSQPGAYAEVSQVTDAPTSISALGSVRDSTLVGLLLEPKDRVPDVTGLTEDEAVLILRRAGLSVSEVVGGGAMIPTTVTRQVPVAGSVIPHSRVVKLIVSGM